MAAVKQTLSAKNKAFWAKTKSEQRVAVAKDVLKQLEIGFFRAMTGDYLTVRTDNKIETPLKADAFFNTLRKEGGKCKVCALGSCFVSLVELGDRQTAKPLFFDNILIDNDYSADEDVIRGLLRKVFVPNQLSMIESAFETIDIIDPRSKFDCDSIEIENAIIFGKKFDWNANRLKAIMKNIIKNKGEFIP